MLSTQPSSSLPFPSSLDRAARIISLKSIKNSIIGKRERKLELLRAGRATLLLDMVKKIIKSLNHGSVDQESAAELVEIITVLGALSLSTPEAVHILLSIDMLSPLQGILKDDEMVFHSEPCAPIYLRLQETIIRTIRNHCVDVMNVAGPSFWGSWILDPKDSTSEMGKVEESLPEVEAALPSEQVVEVRRMTSNLFTNAFSMRPEHEREPDFVDSIFRLLVLHTNIHDPDLTKPIERLRLLEIILDFIGATFHFVLSSANADCGFGVYQASKWDFLAVRRIIARTQGSIQESAVRALAAMIRRQPSAIAIHQSPEPTLGLPAIADAISELTRSSSMSLSLAAVTCRTILWKASSVGSVKSLLPLLLTLMEADTANRADAAFTFAYLIADDEELQAQALLLKCLSRIYTLLTISKPSSSPYSSPAQERATTTFHSALLLSLASLSSSNESHRKQLLDEPSIAFLPLIISNLEHYSPRVRIAAGYCLKGLSRSVGVLRTKLVEVGAVGILLRLLRDEEEEKGVRTVVLAVIGNLLIDFSPLKAPLIAAGCLPLIIKSVRSDHLPLKINALWALKNVTYGSSAGFKNELAGIISWDLLESCIRNAEPEISIPALGILRNLACGFEEGQQPIPGGRTKELIDLLFTQLSSPNDEVLLQMLYCLVNLATAGSSSKEAIMDCASLLRGLVHRLGHENAEVRCAAVWVIVNLTFTPPHARRAHDTIAKLRAYGVEAKLVEMESTESSLNVRERISDALAHFS